MVRLASLTFLLLAPILAACGGDTSASLEKRTHYWQQRLNEEVPPGSSQSQLVQWLDEEGIEYSLTRAEDGVKTDAVNSVVFALEEIKGDGWVCAHWLITGRAVLASNAIERYEVSKQGSCL